MTDKAEKRRKPEFCQWRRRKKNTKHTKYLTTASHNILEIIDYL